MLTSHIHVHEHDTMCLSALREAACKHKSGTGGPASEACAQHFVSTIKNLRAAVAAPVCKNRVAVVQKRFELGKGGKAANEAKARLLKAGGKVKTAACFALLNLSQPRTEC